MKKNHGAAVLVWFLYMFLAGILLAVCMVHVDRASEGNDLFKSPLWMLAALAAFVLSFYLQTIIHELGHLVFGLMTGYKFSSFRVGSFMWIKEEGKVRLKRFSIAGTGGQCIMLPPEYNDGNYKYGLYQLGGVLANVITAVISLVLFFLTAGTAPVAIFFTGLFISGVTFAALNGIPLNSLQVNNDGSNFVELRKSKEARRAVWVQLAIVEGMGQNKRPRDMDQEWFRMPTEEGRKNYLAMSMAVFRENMLMDAHRFEEAADLIDELLAGDYALAAIYRQLLTCDRIYLELIGGGDRGKVEELCDDKQKAAMKQMAGMIYVLRTEYAYALIYENDSEKADKILQAFEKAAAKHPYRVEVESERELIVQAVVLARLHQSLH